VKDWRGDSPDVSWDRARLVASPWFASVRHLVERLPEDRFPALDELNALARERDVRSGGGTPIAFVPVGERGKSLDSHYEVRIFRAGEVQTRAESWHDLFNALVWLAFPRTKATLNRLHHEQLVRRWGEPTRGTARDVLTLFDEGGVVVACAEPGLVQLLREFRWKTLFWQRRAEVMRAIRFFVFGHAILESALAPYKGVTAKALVIDVADEALAAAPAALVDLLDARAADYFARPGALASTRALQPLPVLGIPGWAPENEDPAYYDDERVFRSGRTRGRAAAR
jgi:hypothetical protein